MKKSQLKEAIKAEIKSVLLEGMSDKEREQHIQHLMRTGAKEKPLRKLAAIGKKEDEEDQSQSSSLIGRMGDRSLEEVYQTNSKMKQIVSLFQDMMADEYDGVDYDKVLNLVIKAIDDDYESAERFGEKVSNIREEDEMSDTEKNKAAEKDAKKEKVGKQASKLSQADEDRYERIKNGLEKLKKKGDEESIKRMKAILGKKDVQKLIKAKGRKEDSFM